MTYSLTLTFFAIALVGWATALLPAVASRPGVRDSIRWGAFFLNLLGLLAAAGHLGQLWWITGHPPFRTLQQSLVVFSATTTLAWLAALQSLPIAGLATAGFNVLILGYGLTKGDGNVHELPPALQSVWFIPHVVIYFLGYASLFFSFLTSLLYFRTQRRKSPGREGVDFARWTHKFILFGFCMLSVGLILGSFWAKVAWGDWWSWDAKENWALISWILYGAWLHMRRVEGVSPRATVILSLIGFVAVLFTYLGVNYLPAAQSALHTYASGG